MILKLIKGLLCWWTMLSFRIFCTISISHLCTGSINSSSLADCLWATSTRPYAGTVALTNHGFKCKAWTLPVQNIPSSLDDTSFPADGSAAGASNYCRNFNFGGRPYCHTLDEYISWEFCDFQICGASNKSCDYTVIEPSGVITSPDWDQDGYYEFNVNCFWTVKVGVYNVIRCLDLYVAIQFFSGCIAADFVEISDKYGPLSLLCGFGWVREPMETRSNVMYVQFVSNNFLTASGFNLTYETIQRPNGRLADGLELCGGIIHDPSGVIVSPDSNGDGYYDANANCVWRIEVLEDYVIGYQLEAELYNDCETDALWVYDCKVTLNKKAYCGVHQYYGVTGETVHNRLCIEFRSGGGTELYSSQYDYLGFNIFYNQRKAPDKSCGGILRNSSGYITAPDLDKDGYYDFNLNCVWLIQVNSSKVILYHFDYIAIVGFMQDKCKPDYITVSEISNYGTCSICGRLMQKWIHSDTITYCGAHDSTIEERTDTNEMKVNFVSDNVLSHSGFSMSYKSVDTFICEKTIWENDGYIYPPIPIDDIKDDYVVSCVWTIHAKPDHALQFQIILVRIEDSDDCLYYFVQVIFFMNNREVGYNVRKFCGEQDTQPLSLIPSEKLFIHTILRHGRDEFLIHFENIEGPRGYSYSEIVDVSTSNCIGTVDLQGDGLYEYNMFMLWVLKTDVNKLIMMNILYVDIEKTKRCSSDYLLLKAEQRMYRICGIGLRLMHTSTDNVASIFFTSDHSVVKAGFNITFTTIEGERKECGAVLTGPSGAIESPDQDGDGLYESFVNCLWTIHLHDDYVIVFDIVEFYIQMESGTNTLHCTGDYLEIHEDHKTIGKYCGSSPPTTFTTEANVLYVHFASSYVQAAKGFKATYIQTQDKMACSQHYQCLLNDVIIDKSFLCDDFIDCTKGDDERFCDFR